MTSSSRDRNSAAFCLVAALALVAVSGCGARAYVSAPGAKYPVSLSSAVRGPDGHIVKSGELEKLATFKRDYTACSMLWTIIPFTGTKDISDDINEQIDRKGGEAITNLTVQSSATVWSVMNLVGVLPDCGKVRIRGDIVARIAKADAAPAAPAPAAAPVPASASVPPAASAAPSGGAQ